MTGDGITDFTINPQSTFDPTLFLQIVRKMINDFDINKGIKTDLSKKIDSIITAIQKGKISKAKLKAEQFMKILNKQSENPKRKEQKHHRLTKEEVQTILTMINQLLDNLN